MVKSHSMYSLTLVTMGASHVVAYIIMRSSAKKEESYMVVV